MPRYNPKKMEAKWHKVWAREKIYEPDFSRASRPFYNLMMFPYPSAEGLHIGGVRTFTGVDIYGRFMRMRGFDVFEPIGLDGFGIHSENYALKVGKHPLQHAKDSEKNFYRQLSEIGNGFAWNERLETYDPDYYKWTQWIFTQMFKSGLAYRKKQAVNWCPSCKTVLADEQVISGKCERCSTSVIQKDLEQWFFRITDYAERLLGGLEKIDWTEKIKIAQKNWIGRSEGALIDFEIKTKEKPNFVILHGKGGSPNGAFIPWLRAELEKRGFAVQIPALPNTDEPDDLKQADYVLKHCKFDADTVVLGHSFGGIVALRLLERGIKLRKVILAGTPGKPRFLDEKKRPTVAAAINRGFDFAVIKKNAGGIVLLYDEKDQVVPLEHGELFAGALGVSLQKAAGRNSHFTAEIEPEVLRRVLGTVTVFTTRPDTLFGATYIVLGPEHKEIQNLKLKIQNWSEVENYVKKAKAKTDEERIAEGKEKTGVELSGIKAINPANGGEIPVWVADYVLGGVGTGAIMAVPAHDQRDYDFAKKYDLAGKMVVCPHYPAKTCPVLDSAYEGAGHLVDSGKFNGMESEKAKWEIIKFIGGERKVQFRLRDWLVSRQRYWGPPIPMIFCESCKSAGKGERAEMPGWFAVPEDNLPVKLPDIKEFRPTGTEKSPLATVEKFYKVRCPDCGSWARRETDVSDAFLDSAWYYLRYPSVSEEKKPWDPAITKKWLPVHMYIGGAEHSVLHLLYSRFLAMAFKDRGLINFDEPFEKFRAHGLITKDGAKMSKSKGNVINPDEYIKVYGADAVRMYLAFLAPLPQDGDFNDTGIRGITRFLERVWKLANGISYSGIKDDKIERILHKTIKKVTEDIENLQYNTAISALMILLNEMEKYPDKCAKETIEKFLKLLAPFAPYLTEELYQQAFGGKHAAFRSIHKEEWPEYDPKLLQEDTFELVVQINGKVRDKFPAPVGISEEDATNLTLGRERVKGVLRTLKPRKIIFIPDRLINIVV